MDASVVRDEGRWADRCRELYREQGHDCRQWASEAAWEDAVVQARRDEFVHRVAVDAVQALLVEDEWVDPASGANRREPPGGRAVARLELQAEPQQEREQRVLEEPVAEQLLGPQA